MYCITMISPYSIYLSPPVCSARPTSTGTRLSLRLFISLLSGASFGDDYAYDIEDVGVLAKARPLDINTLLGSELSGISFNWLSHFFLFLFLIFDGFPVIFEKTWGQYSTEIGFRHSVIRTCLRGVPAISFTFPPPSTVPIVSVILYYELFRSLLLAES